VGVFRRLLLSPCHRPAVCRRHDLAVHGGLDRVPVRVVISSWGSTSCGDCGPARGRG